MHKLTLELNELRLQRARLNNELKTSTDKKLIYQQLEKISNEIGVCQLQLNLIMQGELHG